MTEHFNYKYEELFNPTIQALKNLGGSAAISEIEDEVSNVLKLSDDEINDIHKGSRTKFSYRLAWARSYLKNAGILENSKRGVWVLTQKGDKVESVDKERVKKITREKIDEQDKTESDSNKITSIDDPDSEVDEFKWQDNLLNIIKKINPVSFEKLCQRMLRELGFKNVEVTQKSHDGGIDGRGILRLGGVMSFHIMFQAKRYRDTVSSSVIRDFRGAMMGRGDKGLVITTGTFSREAKKEAARDGATPIDLIDGYDLVEKLKELQLGVEVEMVEKVTIIEEWYKSI